MRTTRKQFPVNRVTSGRLPFTIQRAKARRSQQMKKNGGLSGGKMWRDFELIHVLLQLRTYNRNWLKPLHKRVLYKQRQKSVKATAWPSFLLEQLKRGQVALRPHKTRGSYKDDRTSNCVDVFSVERGRKKTCRGLEYFCQGHDQESCGTHLLLLDGYFAPHFTLGN